MQILEPIILAKNDVEQYIKNARSEDYQIIKEKTKDDRFKVTIIKGHVKSKSNPVAVGVDIAHTILGAIAGGFAAGVARETVINPIPIREDISINKINVGDKLVYIDSDNAFRVGVVSKIYNKEVTLLDAIKHKRKIPKKNVIAKYYKKGYYPIIENRKRLIQYISKINPVDYRKGWKEYHEYMKKWYVDTQLKQNQISDKDFKEALTGEGWAIEDYTHMLGDATDEEKKVLKHIRDEEKEHLEELLKLKQNPFVSKSQWRYLHAIHPKIAYKWKKEHPGVMYKDLPEKVINNPTLKIPYDDKETIKHIFEAEKHLRKAGVTFDTGSDFKNRDWELDWSLKGATLNLKNNPTKPKAIKYKIVDPPIIIHNSNKIYFAPQMSKKEMWEQIKDQNIEYARFEKIYDNAKKIYSKMQHKKLESVFELDPSNIKIMMKKTKPSPKGKILTILDATNIVGDMKNYDREHLRVVYLDGRHNIIGIEEASIGSLDSAVLHPREIFKGAILANASAIIVAHNHPSGDTKPSFEDLKVMGKVIKASKIIGINLLDSLIVGNDVYSFLEHGQLDAIDNPTKPTKPTKPDIKKAPAGSLKIHKEWNWNGEPPDKILRLNVADKEPKVKGMILSIIYISDKDIKNKFERYIHEFEDNAPKLGKSIDGFWILGKIKSPDIRPGIQDALLPQSDPPKTIQIQKNLPPMLAYLDTISYYDNDKEVKYLNFGDYDEIALNNNKLKYKTAHVLVTNSRGNRLWIGKVLGKA